MIFVQRMTVVEFKSIIGCYCNLPALMKHRSISWRKFHYRCHLGARWLTLFKFDRSLHNVLSKNVSQNFAGMFSKFLLSQTIIRGHCCALSRNKLIVKRNDEAVLACPGWFAISELTSKACPSQVLFAVACDVILRYQEWEGWIANTPPYRMTHCIM